MARAQAPATPTAAWLGQALDQALAAAAQAQGIRTWIADGTNVVVGVFASFLDGQVTLALTNGDTRVFPLASLSFPDQQAVSGYEDGPAPRAKPPWLPGYRLRYTLRVLDDVLTNQSKTVLAQLPTGGWLKPDASDLMVQTLSGRTLNPAVLSHDPRGQTLIQFNRHGADRWYWVYAVNPAVTSAVEPSLAARIAEARQKSDAATLAKMNAQKAVADKAAAVRENTDQAGRDQATSAKAAAEIAEWDRLLPEREAAAQAAEAKVAPARAAAEALAPVAAAAKAAADQAAEPLRKAAADTAAARTTAAEKTAAAQKAADEAAAATAAADRAAPADKPAADQAARDKAQAAAAAAADKTAADQALAAAEKAEQAAEAAALAPRLAAQKAAAEKAEADRQAAELAAAAQKARQAVTQGQNARAAAVALKAKSDASHQALAAALPGLKAAADQAAEISRQAVETARAASEALLVLAAEADPSLHREGLSVEFRDWAGDELTDWPTVVAGLHRSDTVIGNGWVTEILQYANPFRRDNPRNFAASFRGFLRVETTGVYRFFVNSDDAAFLFINNFIVYSRRGSNLPVKGRIPVYSIGTDIELEAGVHPIEVHQVVGRSPGATGRCTLLWMPPGAKQWALAPSSAFTRGLAAAPVALEEASGAQAAAFAWGMDDCLSSDGVTLYLVRFEAIGTLPNPERLTWNFGDGTTATGRSAWHVYLKPSEVEVSLASGTGLPPHRRRVTPWTPATPTSPRSLARAVEVIGRLDPAKLDETRLTALFEFLLICQQPGRWPVLERVCLRLLAGKNQDVKLRLLLHTALMDALAHQGRADEAIARLDAALAEFPRLPSFRVALQLKAADIHRLQRRDPDQAAALYRAILDANRRSAHPAVRQAAVSLGDLYLDLEDLPRAGEALRLAASLGAGGLGQAPDAATRGALLRVAEQQLKEGNIRQTRHMLERLESEFPEQKLEGLYRFLRGETDRASGRYDEAIRHYEVLLKLRQWAGYRPQAMFGLADCYHRLHELPKCLEWLDALQEGFPAYYSSHKLDEYRAMIEARRQRREAGDPNLAADFSGFHTGFEPDENPPPAQPAGYRRLPSFGMDRPHTALAYNPGAYANATYNQPLRNIASEGWFWVEIWYRNAFSTARGIVNPYLHAAVFRDDNQRGSEMTGPMDSTYGEWYKTGGFVKGPLAQDGRAALSFIGLHGLFELDGLSFMPVTDRERENLRLFIEGAATP
jgi:tetratricopeptide (TPR) repeat protein